VVTTLGATTPTGLTDTASTASTTSTTTLDTVALLGKGKPPGSTSTDNTKGLPEPDPSDEQAITGAIDHLGALSNDDIGTDMFAFMALFQKMAQSMRDTARTQREVQMQAQVSALQGAADQMKEAAEQRFAGAITQGVMQIAGGVAQVGFSVASAANTVKGAQQDAAGQNKLAEATKLDAVGKPSAAYDARVDGNASIELGKISTAQGAKQQALGGATSGIFGGIGGCITAQFNKAADEHDVAKARLEAQAKVADTGHQQANDMMQQMMDVIRDVRDKLQSIQQAAVETNRGIARNI
jgi:hypothetical protein